MNTNAKVLIAIAVIAVISLFIYQNNEHMKEMERLARIEKIEKEKREEERIHEIIRQQEEKDRLAWARAEKINTIAAYEEYKKNNWTGNYGSLADAAIVKLKEEEKRRLEYERRRKEVQRLAKVAGDQIIYQAYQNGINKNTTINDWEYQKGYFGRKGTYTINATLTWNGDWITSNYYKAIGTITFRDDGSDLKWIPTYVNPTLAKYMDDVKGTILGAAIILGTLGALSEE